MWCWGSPPFLAAGKQTFDISHIGILRGMLLNPSTLFSAEICFLAAVLHFEKTFNIVVQNDFNCSFVRSFQQLSGRSSYFSVCCVSVRQTNDASHSVFHHKFVVIVHSCCSRFLLSSVLPSTLSATIGDC